MYIQINKYKISYGGVQPVESGCPSGVPYEYVYQTFGAYKTIVDVQDAITDLKKSSDMQGQKPTDNVEDQAYIDSTYSRISYSGRALRTTDGEMVFSGSEEHIEQFVDEGLVPGWEV
jgi:hypothetical protein